MEMSDMAESKLIERSGDVLGGTPVFAGTRVPVQTLIDYIQASHSLEEFLDDFPTVARAQVIGVLEVMKQPLLVQAA
jgi:uncharacterized protein (DUF433 family)